MAPVCVADLRLAVAGRWDPSLGVAGRRWASLGVAGRRWSLGSVAGRRWSSLVVAGRWDPSLVVAGRWDPSLGGRSDLGSASHVAHLAWNSTQTQTPTQIVPVSDLRAHSKAGASMGLAELSRLDRARPN